MHLRRYYPHFPGVRLYPIDGVARSRAYRVGVGTGNSCRRTPAMTTLYLAAFVLASFATGVILAIAGFVELILRRGTS